MDKEYLPEREKLEERSRAWRAVWGFGLIIIATFIGIGLGFTFLYKREVFSSIFSSVLLGLGISGAGVASVGMGFLSVNLIKDIQKRLSAKGNICILITGISAVILVWIALCAWTGLLGLLPMMLAVFVLGILMVPGIIVINLTRLNGK